MVELLKLPVLFLVLLAFVQAMVPAVSRWYFARYEGGRPASMREILGPRDSGPPMPVAGQRGQRAWNNLVEAMVLFLPVLVLVAVSSNVDQTLAQLGMWVFVIARALYAPIYILGVSTIRSVAWFAGHIGVVMMVIALF